MKCSKVVAICFSILAFASSAEAGRKSFVACPTFVVDDASGTYQILPQAVGGPLRCGNNLAALRRLVYIASEAGDPKTIANPELDTERNFNGIGQVKISKAFRVTSTARVVTVTITGPCSDNYVGVDVIDSNGYDLNGVSAFASVGAPYSLTVFDPGIYGLGVNPDANCPFNITVQ